MEKLRVEAILEDATGLDSASLKSLEDEVRKIGATSVAVNSDDILPVGVRSRGEVTVGTMIVALASAGVLTALIETLRAWVIRQKDRRVRVSVKIGDRHLEFDYSPDGTSEKQLKDFTSSILSILKEQNQAW